MLAVRLSSTTRRRPTVGVSTEKNQRCTERERNISRAGSDPANHTKHGSQTSPKYPEPSTLNRQRQGSAAGSGVSRFAVYSDGLRQVTGLTAASSDRCGEGSAKQCPAGTRGTQACLTTRTTRQCKTSRRHARTLSQSGADAAPGTAYTSLSLHPLYARVHVCMCVHTLRQAQHTHTHTLEDLKCGT